MIRTKDLGNPFAPAYRVSITVGDDDVPCDGGFRTLCYVPAWGFLEQARDRAIVERWALKDSRRNVQFYSGDTHETEPPQKALAGHEVVVLTGDEDGCGYHYGKDANAAYRVAAEALLAEDPTLGEGLYP